MDEPLTPEAKKVKSTRLYIGVFCGLTLLGALLFGNSWMRNKAEICDKTMENLASDEILTHPDRGSQPYLVGETFQYQHIKEIGLIPSLCPLGGTYTFTPKPNGSIEVSCSALTHGTIVVTPEQAVLKQHPSWR